MAHDYCCSKILIFILSACLRLKPGFSFKLLIELSLLAFILVWFYEQRSFGLLLSFIVCFARAVFFVSKNLLLFFLLFEASLLPILVLIFIFGVQADRIRAINYIVIYTLGFGLPAFYFVWKLDLFLVFGLTLSLLASICFVFYRAFLFGPQLLLFLEFYFICLALGLEVWADRLILFAWPFFLAFWLWLRGFQDWCLSLFGPRISFALLALLLDWLFLFLLALREWREWFCVSMTWA